MAAALVIALFFSALLGMEMAALITLLFVACMLSLIVALALFLHDIQSIAGGAETGNPVPRVRRSLTARHRLSRVSEGRRPGRSVPVSVACAPKVAGMLPAARPSTM
jgi:hypothetical protein